MNLNIIRKRCQEGDTVVFTITGDKVLQGLIVDFDDDVIVIKDSDSNEVFICGDDIKTFKKITNTSVAQNNNIISEDVCKSEKVKEDVSNNKSEQEPCKEASSVNSGVFPEDGSSKPLAHKEYKVGDIIPLEELKKIDPDSVKPKITKVKKSKAKGKWEKIGGLEDLGKLVEAEHELDNQKIVPALGEIKYISGKEFGFIYDAMSGEQIYFGYNQLLDQSIKVKTPVVYSLSTNYKGSAAVSIHRPQKIVDLIRLANDLISNGNYTAAEGVINNILNAYPDNYTATKLKQQLDKLLQHDYSHSPYAIKGCSIHYAKAKKYADNKDFVHAFEEYEIAIKNGERLESSIKDVASLYANLYRSSDNEKDKKEYHLDSAHL